MQKIENWKAKLLEYQERLSKYGEQELYISKALVKAEESAQAILRESYQKNRDRKVKNKPGEREMED